MAKFVPDFVRKAVTKWKYLTHRDGGAEWEPMVEQKAANTWDSHAQPLPDDVKELDERDSGYASCGDTSSKTSRESTPVPDTPGAIKYLQLSFRTKHYFLTHIQKILEATCLRYAQRHLKCYLEDPAWKKIHLLFPSNEYPPDRLVYRDWLAEDEIELEFWMRMFAKSSVPLPKKSQRIFESVIDLRNAAVHREDRGALNFETFSLAMALPALLGDSKCELDISNAFRYVTEDPTLDDAIKASVHIAIYSPQPCTTRYQLLARIQVLLEESCFHSAARLFPHSLEQRGWFAPEQIELQNWHDVFKTAAIKDAGCKIFPSGDHCQCLLDLLHAARLDIRIVAAHRLPIDDEKLVTQVERAVKIARLLGDARQVGVIERVAEMWFGDGARDGWC